MLRVNSLSGFGVIKHGADADYLAYIAATGITDSTKKSAVLQLVLDLKGYGIWTKCKAIYPFPGDTATVNKYNLKDPRDLDAAFRLVFNGTVTHASTGMTPNGSTGYADTFLNGSVQSLDNDSHLSVYVRTSTAAGDKLEIGAYNGLSSFWAIKSRDTGDFLSVGSYRFTSTGFMQSANSDSRGFYMEKRTSSAGASAWKNGSSVNTTTTTAFGIPSSNVAIGARGGSVASYSDREIAFASIGQGLSDTEAANFYTAVQAYQTTLSRQI